MAQTNDKIMMYFTFVNATGANGQQQIYLEVDNKYITLRQALSMLAEKYSWLKRMTNVMLYIEGARIFTEANLDQAVCNLGIEDNTNITIDCNPVNAKNEQLFRFANLAPAKNQQINPNLPNNFQNNQNQFNNFQNQGFNNVHMQNQPLFNPNQNNMNINMNNQNMNMMNQNINMNNIQNQPFYCYSSRLRDIYTFLRNNGFCQNQYDHQLLINFLNYLFQNGYVLRIPTYRNNKVWKNFYDCRNVKNNDFKEAVYRISHLFANINQNDFLKIFATNQIGFNIFQYTKQRMNMNNQMMMNNQNMNMMNQNKMNMNNKMVNNNQMMNQNMNMQNNFNLMNGFWQGNWFTWDKRPIEALINAAGLNVNKYTLYNHICKKIHEIDWQLQQPATYTNEKQYITYINRYNQALRFLSLYFADIIENFDPKHYSYYFKNYNSMYRFLPPYVDPMNKSQQYGKVTFYNTAAGRYGEFPLAQLDNTYDLPEICNNVGATCYANACRNMILSNKMLRVVLSSIGKELLSRNPDMCNAIKNLMNDNTPVGSLCSVDAHCQHEACDCTLNYHARSVVALARDKNKNWGVLEMLCLYACCADLAKQIDNPNNRINFLSKIFTATMVIIGDKEPLFRQAGAGDANDLSNNLNEILTNSLSSHIKREVPISGITKQEQMEAERQSRSLYGCYNIGRELADNSAIPGQLAVKVNVTEPKCGHNKFGAEFVSFTPLTTMGYTSPGLPTQGRMFYDLQNALSLENSPTLLQGDGSYCNACKRSFNARYCPQPVCGSLLSQLRPNYGPKNSGKNRVVFNEYVVNWKVPTTRPPEVYQLKCFIVHTGGHGLNGHFISYHKVPTGGNSPYQWCRLDDGILTTIDNKTIQYILQKPSFGDGSVAMRLCYERVPFFQMMSDLYGKFSVSHLTIPSHEDLKLSDPLYMSFFNKGNNNYGEPNPNNPYTAVHGLQQLLINLDLGHLVTQQAYNNVRNQYTTWNNNAQCAWYNNNLPAQQMNNMIMKNFVFPQQQFMQPFNNNVNVNMINQGNGVAASF